MNGALMGHGERVYLAFMLPCTNLSLHACWMLWSSLTMNISNDPSGVCVFLCEQCSSNEAVDLGLEKPRVFFCL